MKRRPGVTAFQWPPSRHDGVSRSPSPIAIKHPDAGQHHDRAGHPHASQVRLPLHHPHRPVPQTVRLEYVERAEEHQQHGTYDHWCLFRPQRHRPHLLPLVRAGIVFGPVRIGDGSGHVAEAARPMVPRPGDRRELRTDQPPLRAREARSSRGEAPSPRGTRTSGYVRCRVRRRRRARSHPRRRQWNRRTARSRRQSCPTW